MYDESQLEHIMIEAARNTWETPTDWYLIRQTYDTVIFHRRRMPAYTPIFIKNVYIFEDGDPFAFNLVDVIRTSIIDNEDMCPNRVMLVGDYEDNKLTVLKTQ